MYGYNPHDPNQQQQQHQQYGYQPPQHGGAPPPPGGPGGPPRQPSPYAPQGQPQQSPYMPQGDAHGYQPPQDQGMLSPGASAPGYGMQQMTAGMAGMSMGGGAAAVPEQQPAAYGGAARKKKSRHAHHTLDAPEPTPSLSPGMMSQPGIAAPPQEGAGGFVTPAFQQPGLAPQQGGLQAPGQHSMPSPMFFQPQSAFQQHPSQGMGGQGLGEYNTTIKPATGPGSGQQRLDPDQIPSVPAAREAAQREADTMIYPTIDKHLPPPSTCDFVAHDQGNSSPKFARMTLNNIPATQELLGMTGLPLALMVTPLALQKPEEGVIPVLDFGDAGPPRCRRCRTYINPFMQFTQGGSRFACNMCLFPNNEVVPEYFAPIDHTGRRVDRDTRPELSRGTVEFVVPKEYWAKEPVPMKWLFIVETGRDAVDKGWVDAICRAIRESVYGAIEEDEATEEKEGTEGTEGEEKEKEIKGRRLPKGCQIGIMTYDKEICFYNLSSKLEAAQLMVMADLEDPFVPLEEGLFVDPYESRSQIEGLLNLLPTMFVATKTPETAVLPALTTAASALEKSGGRVVCCMTSLPTLNVTGRLTLRDEPGATGDKEKSLFTTDNHSYKKLASKMVEAGVGVDFFMGPGTYIDVATLGHVSATTGGETYFYPNFVATRDTPKLIKELTHSLTRENGFQALMKVRCSNGLQVANAYGNYHQKTFGADLELGVIDSDKTIVVVFSYDGKLDPKLDAHFQSALLYTTATGERRVRVQNVVAAVTEAGREVLRFADQDAIIATIAKEAAMKMPDKALKEIRGGITETCIQVYSCYRKHFSASAPASQLVLPEGLKEFCMYMLGLIKCRAFRGGNVSSDMRTHAMRLIRQLPPGQLLSYLYPRIIPLHSLTDEQGFASPETGRLLIPQQLRASFARIEEGGAYLVDNGQVTLMWLHQHVSPNLLADMFGEGVGALHDLDPFKEEIIPVLPTHLNAQTRNLITWLEDKRGNRGCVVQLARQGLDGAEFEFAGLLVEDRNNEAQSYVDWLVHIHRHVQLEITGQRRKEDHQDDPSLTGFTGMRAPYW